MPRIVIAADGVQKLGVQRYTDIAKEFKSIGCEVYLVDTENFSTRPDLFIRDVREYSPDHLLFDPHIFWLFERKKDKTCSMTIKEIVEELAEDCNVVLFTTLGEVRLHEQGLDEFKHIAVPALFAEIQRATVGSIEPSEELFVLVQTFEPDKTLVRYKSLEAEYYPFDGNEYEVIFIVEPPRDFETLAQYRRQLDELAEMAKFESSQVVDCGTEFGVSIRSGVIRENLNTLTFEYKDLRGVIVEGEVRFSLPWKTGEMVSSAKSMYQLVELQQLTEGEMFRSENDVFLLVPLEKLKRVLEEEPGK